MSEYIHQGLVPHWYISVLLVTKYIFLIIFIKQHTLSLFFFNGSLRNKCCWEGHTARCVHPGGLRRRQQEQEWLSPVGRAPVELACLVTGCDSQRHRSRTHCGGSLLGAVQASKLLYKSKCWGQEPTKFASWWLRLVPEMFSEPTPGDCPHLVILPWWGNCQLSLWSSLPVVTKPISSEMHWPVFPSPTWRADGWS